MLLNISNNKKMETIDIDEILQDIRILYSNPISATTENASSKIEMRVIRTAIGGIQFVFAWIAYPCLLFVSFITREYSSKPRSPEYKNYYTDHVTSISSQELILPPTVSQETLIKESISQQEHEKSLVLFCKDYDSMYTNFYSSPNTSMSTVSTITMNHDNRSVPFNYGMVKFSTLASTAI